MTAVYLPPSHATPSILFCLFSAFHLGMKKDNMEYMNSKKYVASYKFFLILHSYLNNNILCFIFYTQLNSNSWLLQKNVSICLQ